MNPLPEERLLKLIRGRSARPASEPAAATQAGGPAASAATPVPLPARLIALRWSALAVWVLGAILALEVGCLIVQALRPLPPVPVVSTPAQEPALQPPAVPEIPLLAASISRPLFTASPAPGGAGGPAAPSQPVSSSAKELAARLTLMGIVSGNPPQAIIEDAQTKKTYFVTAGQSVVEGAVLEQVLDNRVVLSLMGEKIELSL